MPSLLGLPLQEAITVLSCHNLNARILTEKEETDISPGTILSQNPAPQQKIKPQQSVYLVIAKKAHAAIAPELTGCIESEARKRAENLGIRLKTYAIESQHPQEYCIAQSPAPGSELAEKLMILYVSASTVPMRIFPDLRGLQIADVHNFLEKYTMQLVIMPIHDSISERPAGTVLDQKPLAGSLIDIRKPLTIHVSVQS